MHGRYFAAAGLLILGTCGAAVAQDIQWRPAAAPTQASPIRLGKPQSANHSIPSQSSYVPLTTPRVVRGQLPDQPPPPPPPPGSSPIGGALPGGAAGEEAYNCGVANAKPGTEGFFSRFCDNVRKGFSDVGNSAGSIFQPGPAGRMFHSDDKFNGFISPVSNPFYFEDPRALTELRPIFIWQSTPGGNPIYAGGSNFFFGTQARVAFTDQISLVINKLGLVSSNPDNTAPGFSDSTGFAEFHLGPKFTVIRNDTSNTLLALGLNFEIPIGSSSVQQSTGDLSLVPYFSFAQSFWRSDYGTFNFLNTTGYVARVDSRRTDNIFASFHLDYDVGNWHRIYPLLELNFAHYTFNGSVQSLGFEGRDMFNFGSDGVAGTNILNLAFGARYKFSEAIQIGLVGEVGLVGGSSNLDSFRLTIDMIFRY